MSNIFKRRSGTEPSLDSVRFDTDGYEARGEPRPGEVRAWCTSKGDALGLYYFAVPPDLPRAPTVDDLRGFYAASLEASGGQLVEVSTLRVGDCPALRVIFKTPQQPSGMTYVGSLTIPFREFSFVLKVQCEEESPAGLREAVLLDRRLAAGEAPSVSEGHLHIPNWNPDEESSDAEFPDHPVSRTRQVLDRIERSVQVDRDVRKLPPFVLPEGST